MRKGLIALCFILASGAASAQSDFALTIDVPNGFQAGAQFYDTILIDVNMESRFLSANGMVVAVSGFATPATGSCFFTAMDGVMCNLQVDQNSYTMDIASNFIGTLTRKDGTGSVAVVTPVEILSVD